jgi:hypothetical protein
MIKDVLQIVLGALIAAFIVGVLAMAMSIDRYPANTRSQWPTVTGIVIHSSAFESSSNDEAPTVMFGLSDEDWNVAVSFEYEIDGVRYSSHQMWVADQSEARSQKAKYSPGAAVPIYYNPKRTSSSVVEPREVYYNSGDRFLLPLLIGIPGLVFAGRVAVAGIGPIVERRRCHKR